MDWQQLLKLPGASKQRLQRIVQRQLSQLDRLWLCPQKVLPTPDPWQVEVLKDTVSSWILNASRQSGKTEVVAGKVLWELLCCGSFVLVVSRSQDQALEFHRRVMGLYYRLPLVEPTEDPTKSQLLLQNGARLLCLPNNEATVRCYSKVDLLVLDEAARVPDNLFGAVRPMLAVSGGRTVALSTPFGQRGWFHKEWTEGRHWQRKEIPWWSCPRIPKSFINDEREKHGELWVRQEYGCEFLSIEESYFNVEAFGELIDADLEVIPSW